MASLGDLMVRIGATIDGFSDAMKSVVSQAGDAADKVADKLGQVGDVGQHLAVLGGSLTAAITVPLEEIARRSIDVAGNFEQTRIAFSTLLGSSAAAKVKLEELYQFAASTPFELPQVLAGARQITAFGFSSHDIIPILATVGDAVSALGTGQAGMGMILANLGKMKTEGHATSETLNHLAEDGINSWQMLANAMGKSIPEVQKMVTKREVTSDAAINALLAGMNTQFGGLMKNQMVSFGGMMSNFKDQITLTAAAIGDSLLPAGKTMLNWAQAALEHVKNLAQWFAQLPAPIQASAITLAAFAAAAGPALVALGGLGMAIPHIAAGIMAITKLWGSLSAAAAGIAEYGSTIVALVSEYGVASTAGLVFTDGIGAISAAFLGIPGLIALGVAAMAALATWVFTHWAGVKAAFAQVFDGLGDVWNVTLGVPVNWAIQTFTRLIEDTKPIWSTFGSFVAAVWHGIADTVMTIWNGIKSNVIDPMIKFFESIPGMSKIAGAGAAFDKGEKDKASSDRLGEAKIHLLGGSGQAPKLSDPAIDWAETHNRKLETATADLKTLKEAFDQGKVSAEEFHKAMARVDALKSEKNPFSNAKAADKEGKTKLDRNALDGLSGEHKHEEAQLALQRAQIEHDYQMAKPGSAAKQDESAEDLARADIAAAEKRKAALDATYEDERQKTLKILDDKLKLYRGDQNGHQALINAKRDAEDKYNEQIQKTTFDLENVKKQSIDRIQAAQNKAHDEEIKAQEKNYQESIKTLDNLVEAKEAVTQRAIKQAQFEAQQEDKRLLFELETGRLSKQQYLELKQQQYDAAYVMEIQALQEERDLIDSSFEKKLDEAPNDIARAKVMSDYEKRSKRVEGREQDVENRHTGQQQETGIAKERDRIAQMDKNFFTPFENGFSKGISNMVKGIQTFKQAWSSMMVGMLSQWIDHVAQMAAQWVTAKLRELVVHATTNQAKVASDQMAAAQSRGISISQHMHEVMLSAKLAAAKTWAAVSGIPVIGPILAPVAAAAAFAGVFAISAESGAVLPNHDTVGFLHPQEMVLPKGISVGLQNLIASGGLSNASGMMNQSQGGSLSSTALQMMRNTNAADTGDTHHNYHGPMHYHAAPGEAMTVNTFGKLFNTYVRQNNLKMA